MNRWKNGSQLKKLIYKKERKNNNSNKNKKNKLVKNVFYLKKSKSWIWLEQKRKLSLQIRKINYKMRIIKKLKRIIQLKFRMQLLSHHHYNLNRWTQFSNLKRFNQATYLMLLPNYLKLIRNIMRHKGFIIKCSWTKINIIQIKIVRCHL